MCPRRARAFFPSEGRGGRLRRSCGLDAGGEVDPNPGDGGFSPWEGRGLFCRLRRRGELHAAACGERCCRAAAGALQKGVQDTRTCVPVSYTPSCDSP